MSETIKSTDKCPCGSGKTYAECCEPLITGKSKALTAEALMRARYTAYVVHAIDFIINTCETGEQIAEIDRKATEDWSNKSTWHGLKILRTERVQKATKKVLLNSKQPILRRESAIFTTKLQVLRKLKVNGFMLKE